MSLLQISRWSHFISKLCSRNPSARYSSNSGLLGGFARLRSSGGSTIPTLKYDDHTRFTIAWVKYGFDSSSIQANRISRGSSTCSSFISLPPRTVAVRPSRNRSSCSFFFCFMSLELICSIIPASFSSVRAGLALVGAISVKGTVLPLIALVRRTR